MATINGTPGDDVITGTPEGDTINGGDGNDTITDSGPGVTVINGDAGNDTIRYRDFANGLLNANITINGGTGNDTVFFDSLHLDAASRVTITLGDGNDVLHIGTATRFDDRPFWFSYGYSRPFSINLGTGSDALVLGYYLGRAIGSAFEDFDIGGAGVLRVTGFSAGASGDVINLGDMMFGLFPDFDAGLWDGTRNPFAGGFLRLVQVGNDVVLRFDSNGLADTSPAIEREILRLVNVQASNLVAANFGGYDPSGAALASVTLDGTAGNDVLRGTAARNTINGLGGDDIIIGSATPDIIDGGIGNDTISGGFGDDTINGGDGNDVIDGGAGNDTINGGAGNDTIDGGIGDDVIDGGDGDDIITDNLGDDIIRGGAGNDRITSDRPAFPWLDQQTEPRGAETVVIVAGDGNDEVIFRVNGGQVGFNLFESPTTLTVDLGAGDDAFTFGGLGTFATITTGTGRDRITIETFGFAITITDFQTGTNGDVVNLVPFVGPYIEFDFSVNPFSTGVLQLQQNGTSVELWFDQDGTSGFAPRELLITFQNTTLSAFNASNFLGLSPDGSPVPPTTVTGTSGDDTLLGTLGPDALNGLGGNDILLGFEGNDILDGGDGNDRLEGGSGNDRLIGGAGDDTLIITNGSDTALGGAGRDLIIHDGVTGSMDTIIIDAGADDDTVELRSLLFFQDGSHRHDVSLGDGNDRLLVTNIGTRGLNASLGAGSDYVWLSPALAGALVQGNMVITDFQAGAGGDVLDLADYANIFFEGQPGAVRLLQVGNDVVVQMRRPIASLYEGILVLENVLATDFVFSNLNIAFTTATVSANPTQVQPSLVPEPVLPTVTTAVPQTLYRTTPVTVGANEVYYAFDATFVPGEFRNLGVFLVAGDAAFVNNGTIWNEMWTAPFVSDTMGVFAGGSFENNGLIYTEVQAGIALGAGYIGGNGINRGDIIARTGLEGPAIAIRTEAQINFENLGLLAAQSYASEAIGVEFINGGQFINRAGGEIIVEGIEAIGVRFGRGLRFRDGFEIVNQGLIRAISLDPDQLSVGLDLSHLLIETMRVQNSGTIIADLAIVTNPFFVAPPQLAREEITNTATGRIEGIIALSLGDDLLVNQGTIVGDVYMGFGADVVDMTGGRWSGDIISLDFGNDRFLGSLDADFVSGGFGDDELRGAEGNDLLIGNRGDDILIGGAGNDGLYGEYGNDTLTLQGGDRAFGGTQDDTFILTDYTFAEARGEQGFDTLVLAQAAARIFDLSAALASGRLSGFERIELGGSHGLVVRAGDVAGLSDVNNTLVVSETAAGASVRLLGSWATGAQQQLGGQTFNTYTLGNETVLVLSAIEVTVGGSAPANARGLDAVAGGAAAPRAGDSPGTARDLPVTVANGFPIFEDFVVAPWDIWTSDNGNLVFIPQPGFNTDLENFGVIISETLVPDAGGAAAIQLESRNNLLNEGYVGAIANQIGNAITVLVIGIGRVANNNLIEAIADQGRAIAVVTGTSETFDLPALVNTGEIYAESTAGEAIAVYDRNADSITNSGNILALGATAATAVLVDQSNTIFTNTGNVIARTSNEAANAIAFDIFFSGQLEVINSGRIDGSDFAFRAINISNPSFVTVTNNGDIFGDFLLTGSANTITNAGYIEGDITFGNFADVYDGAGGTHNGVVRGGGGNDQLRGTEGTDRLFGDSGADTLLGRGGVDFLTGGLGNDVINGGSNVDTAIVRGLRSQYTVTQTSTGVFRVVGPDGTDTLTAIEFLQFDDQTIRLLPGTGVSVNFNTADPSIYQTAMNAIRDFDGNALGGNGSWLRIGQADVNGDGDIDQILVNRAIGRFATVGTAPDGLVYFADHGWAGETRVAGIYIDPLVAAGIVQAGGPNDSQRRFQNDLQIENINRVLGADDYDNDGLQEVYFALTDGTAFLRAIMEFDGNIRYANYQSQQEVIDYLTANGFGPETYAGWFGNGSSSGEAALGADQSLTAQDAGGRGAIGAPAADILAGLGDPALAPHNQLTGRFMEQTYRAEFV